MIIAKGFNHYSSGTHFDISISSAIVYHMWTKNFYTHGFKVPCLSLFPYLQINDTHNRLDNKRMCLVEGCRRNMIYLGVEKIRVG